MIKKMNIAFIASTLALLSTLYSCKKETITNSELKVGSLELVAGSLNVSGAKFKVAISDPAGIAGKKRLCYSSTVQSPTIDTAGKAIGQDVFAVGVTEPSSIALTNLKMNTTYYVRAAVVTKSGAIVYSDVLKITTTTITAGTLGIVNESIRYEEVTLTTSVSSSGLREGNIYYSTIPNPATTVGAQFVQNEAQVILKGLIPGTKYYAQIGFKAASGEMILGNQLEFTTKAYALGQEYKGGIIFYISDNKINGLIVAKEDIGYGETDPNKIIFPWGLYEKSYPINKEDGLENTKDIIKAINNPAISDQTAAGQCLLYKPNDPGSFQTDWYLPSKQEFQYLINANPAIGMYIDDYWLSTADVGDNKYALRVKYDYNLSTFGNGLRDQKARVRAIHKF